MHIFAYFWRHIRPYWPYYLTMMMAPIIGGFYPTITNYALKQLLDLMVQPLTMANAFSPIALFFGAQLMLEVAWRLNNFAAWRSEPFVRAAIMTEAYDHLQSHPYGFFQSHFSGTISSKMKGIIDGYDNFWFAIHQGGLLNLMIVCVNTIALFTVNLTLGLFMLTWSIAFATLAFFLSKKLNRCAFIESESRHGIIAFIADRVSNINTVLTYCKRPKEKQALSKYFKNDFIPKQVKTYQCNFMIQAICGLAYLIMFAFTLIETVHLRIIGDISIGDFAFILALTLSIAENLWHSMAQLQDFAQVMGDMQSALSIIYTPHPRTYKSTPAPISQPTVHIEALDFAYDQGPSVLSNLSTTFKPGENIGIVGHSGAGKSTLIHLILQHYHPTHGAIRLNHHDLSDYHPDFIRQHIAYIPQDTQLFHQSIRQNICYPNPDVDEKTLIDVCKKTHLHELIMSMPEGYETVVGERGLKLSGGQRQRIAIARALIKKAPILLLDEATSALDSQTEKHVQDSLKPLFTDPNTTVIAIAHRLSTLTHMDRILVLDQGKIVEEGAHHELIKRAHSHYKTLWEQQCMLT